MWNWETSVYSLGWDGIFLPEKNQNNAPGHRRHDASTTTGCVRLWFIQNTMINM